MDISWSKDESPDFFCLFVFLPKEAKAYLDNKWNKSGILWLQLRKYNIFYFI